VRKVSLHYYITSACTRRTSPQPSPRPGWILSPDGYVSRSCTRVWHPHTCQGVLLAETVARRQARRGTERPRWHAEANSSPRTTPLQGQKRPCEQRHARHREHRLPAYGHAGRAITAQAARRAGCDRLPDVPRVLGVPAAARRATRNPTRPKFLATRQRMARLLTVPAALNSHAAKLRMWTWYLLRPGLSPSRDRYLCGQDPQGCKTR